MTGFTVVIPARYASTRLPGKPLLEIAGKPMVIWVGERALASGADAVYIATDHEQVADTVRKYSMRVCMTRGEHASGTDRIAEAADQLRLPDDAVIVNVQGDEPLVSPRLISDLAAQAHTHPAAAVCTVCHRILDRASMFDLNQVKVVLDHAGYALYFSRAPIPYARDAFAAGEQPPPEMPVYRHVGMYAYRAGFLRSFTKLQQAPIERFEALEQLRVLWHGYRIHVAVSEHAPAAGVDTPQDLQRVRAYLESL
ncbi:MAG: 3-deoxy-manno-octulosonate cytidylyltransferase [Burkholderiales bacterium]